VLVREQVRSARAWARNRDRLKNRPVWRASAPGQCGGQRCV